MTTWTPKTQESEAWTATAARVFVFDPNVFDRHPTFDTLTAGLWTEKSEDAEVWTPA